VSGHEHDIGRSYPSGYEKRMRKQERETREKERSKLDRKISDFLVLQDERPSAIGETESLSSTKDKTPQTMRTLEPQPEYNQ
jgi:hypothetical protein